MNADACIRILREGMVLILLLSAAPLGAALAVGFVVNIFQEMTQLKEQTISQVPKLVAVLAVLAIAAPWMLAQLLRFTRLLWESIVLIH